MMSLSVSFSSRRSWLCDRRVTNAELPPAGRTLTERALAVYSAGLRELVLQRLGLDGLRTLADHMSRLGCDVRREDRPARSGPRSCLMSHPSASTPSRRPRPWAVGLPGRE